MLLTESKLTEVLTEGMKYHLDTKTPLYENVYRPGSEAYFSTIKQARHLLNKGLLSEVCLEDMELLFETEVGEYGMFEGEKVPLDFPMVNEATVVTEPQTTEYTQAWNAAKQDEVIRNIVEDEARKKNMEPYNAWLDMASKGKAGGGAAYTVGAASVSQYLSEEDMNPDADVSRVMPILAEYMLEGNKKYTILTGQDTFREIQSENVDVWVVDLTIYQEESKETIAEAKYQGREVKLNKPKRGGSKAYFVYTRNPKTGKTIKVSFGSGGLKAKINNAKARKSFAKRHNCPAKKDKTKAGYWSCRLPRYASLLGLKSSFGGYW